MMWKAIDRYSKDYVELQTKDKVKFYKTPDSILQKQLEIFDSVMEKRKDNAMFVEIIASQKKFAERAVRWDLDTYVSRRMAYNYYFGPEARRTEEGLTPRSIGGTHHPAARMVFFFLAVQPDRGPGVRRFATSASAQ